MPINRVVVNASPLICLFKSGLADLLPSLFTEVIVPEEVWHEILAQGIRSAADLENSRKGYVNELMDLLREHQEFHQSSADPMEGS